MKQFDLIMCNELRIILGCFIRDFSTGNLAIIYKDELRYARRLLEEYKYGA